MSFCSLLYHGVADRRRWGYISPDALRQQFEWLCQKGFVIEGFGGLEGRSRVRDVPSGYVVVTFDDGHRSSLLGAEMLAELGGCATFFVATGSCRSDARYFDKAALRRLAEIAEVGSHTVSHPRLTRLRKQLLLSELLDSKHWLEDVVGREITYLSAPYGAINRRVVDTALECGYRLVGTSKAAANDPALISRHHVVYRVAVDSGMSFAAFLRAVTTDPAFFRRRRLRTLLFKLPREMMRRGLPRNLERKIIQLRSRLR